MTKIARRAIRRIARYYGLAPIGQELTRTERLEIVRRLELRYERN